jgi:hypothetical protein
MTVVAICSADPVLRCSLEQLLRGDPAMTVVGVADNPSAILRLIDQNHVDAVLADSPSHEQLADWRTRHAETAFVVLTESNGLFCKTEGSSTYRGFSRRRRSPPYRRLRASRHWKDIFLKYLWLGSIQNQVIVAFRIARRQLL